MAFRQQCCFCIDRKLIYQNLCVVNNGSNNEGAQKILLIIRKHWITFVPKSFLIMLISMKWIL